MTADAGDPVLARRERIKRLVELGQRLGYGLFAVAVVGFVAGFAAEFPTWLVSVTVVSLVAGSFVLAPAIVIGYGVRAAEREDRERG